MQLRTHKIPYLKIDDQFPLNTTLDQFLMLRKLFCVEPNSKLPWVIIRFLGVFPLFAHYNLDTNDFWKLPANYGFKIRIDPEKYEEILSQYLLQIKEQEAATKELPLPKFFQEKDIYQYILDHQLWRIDSKLNKLSDEKINRLLKQNIEIKWGVEALLKGYSVIPVREIKIQDDVRSKLPKELAERFKAVCYGSDNNYYYVVMTSPVDALALEDEFNNLYATDTRVKIVASYAPPSVMDVVSDNTHSREVLSFESDEEEITRNGPKIFYCDRYNEVSEEAMWVDPKHMLALILKKAIREGASDIHVQEMEDKVDIRFRMNTFLANRLHFPKKFLSRINSIICQYGGIDPLKKLIPHSGRFTAVMRDECFEIRVSMIPMKEEQSCVMRIHGEKAEVQSLDILHLNYKDEILFKDALTRKSGIILITGPTGSGKSTTLYAALKELNREDISIETIEDPIEKHIAGIKQFQVRYAPDKEKSLTFPKLFREILRHDPDVIMVGEIRDLETANQAVIAAQTGHLVLSTIHTQDALGAIPRLISEGVNPQHLADALILLQAQRLIGTVCKNCRKAVEKGSQLEKIILTEFWKESIVYDESEPIYQAGKCDYCNYTGYDGKQAIFEFFPIIEEVREKIASGQNIHEIRKNGSLVGHRTLYQEGLQQVALGVTTFDEVSKYRREARFDYKKLLKTSQERLVEGHR